MKWLWSRCVLLGEGPSFKMLRDEVQEQAEHCNKMKRNAKIAGVSARLWRPFDVQWFLCYLLLDCTCTGTKWTAVSRCLLEGKSSIFLSVCVCVHIGKICRAQECGPWTGTGMVTAVLNRAVDIFIFQFGLVKRVYCEVCVCMCVCVCACLFMMVRCMQMSNVPFSPGSNCPWRNLTMILVLAKALCWHWYGRMRS